MTGGLMQLVAMGTQDVYITGNPQITFFKVIYRRHTNFSKECIVQTFSGSLPEKNEGSVKCTLARNGDLVQEIYLKITTHAEPGDSIELNINSILYDGTFTLDSAINANANKVYFTEDVLEDSIVVIKKNTVYYVSNLAGNTFKISETDGGDVITFTSGSSITGGVSVKEQQLDANDLSGIDMTKIIKVIEVEIGGQVIDKHYSQWLDIYNELFETKHDLRMAMCDGSDLLTPNIGATNYIPLRFWFNRNPGLALPLISLQYHEVRINVTLNPVNLDGLGKDCEIIDASLLVNYLYLDTDERRRFAQVSHEYLIEQVQHTGYEDETPILMNFNHPVKALFWTAPGALLGTAKIQLNGDDRAAQQPHDYYHLVQPYECGLGHSGKSLNTNTRKWGSVVNTNINNNIGMYSFCLKPAEHQPSGTCNFSRIDNSQLHIEGIAENKPIYLFALNYNVLRIMSGMGGLAYSN
tara:strand:- start:202 stop:1602 length:1401 start_codon:yes stop_codon:yes gene_type:complete